MPLELTQTNEQQTTVHLTPVTAGGKPAKLDGVPSWSVVSGPATVAPSDDGLSATIASNADDLGDTVVQVSADADIGEGVEEVADTILMHTTHANAKSLGLTADAPVTQP